jgi:hypothetical protein
MILPLEKSKFTDCSVVHSGEERVSMVVAEPRFDASHQLGQMHFGDPVIGPAAFFFIAQKTAPLHKPQMLRRHVTGNPAGLGKFPDGIAIAEQHLHHPQTVRMR